MGSLTGSVPVNGKSRVYSRPAILTMGGVGNLQGDDPLAKLAYWIGASR